MLKYFFYQQGKKNININLNKFDYKLKKNFLNQNFDTFKIQKFYEIKENKENNKLFDYKNVIKYNPEYNKKFNK
jgi:hypothetical protein